MKKNKGKSNFIITARCRQSITVTCGQNCKPVKNSNWHGAANWSFFSHSKTLFYRKLEKGWATYVLIPWQEGLWLFVVQSHHLELNI